LGKHQEQNQAAEIPVLGELPAGGQDLGVLLWGQVLVTSGAIFKAAG
jgi:hypothetical protein